MTIIEEFRILKSIQAMLAETDLKNLKDYTNERIEAITAKMMRRNKHTNKYTTCKPDIVETISKHTNLKKVSTHKYRGKCPIHKGDNPLSLSVDEESDLFFCFSCHRGGDVFTFLSELENEPIDVILRRHHTL